MKDDAIVFREFVSTKVEKYMPKSLNFKVYTFTSYLYGYPLINFYLRKHQDF